MFGRPSGILNIGICHHSINHSKIVISLVYFWMNPSQNQLPTIWVIDAFRGNMWEFNCFTDEWILVCISVAYPLIYENPVLPLSALDAGKWWGNYRWDNHFLIVFKWFQRFVVDNKRTLRVAWFFSQTFPLRFKNSSQTATAFSSNIEHELSINFDYGCCSFEAVCLRKKKN